MNFGEMILSETVCSELNNDTSISVKINTFVLLRAKPRGFQNHHAICSGLKPQLLTNACNINLKFITHTDFVTIPGS